MAASKKSASKLKNLKPKKAGRKSTAPMADQVRGGIRLNRNRLRKHIKDA